MVSAIYWLVEKLVTAISWPVAVLNFGYCHLSAKIWTFKIKSHIGKLTNYQILPSMNEF